MFSVFPTQTVAGILLFATRLPILAAHVFPTRIVREILPSATQLWGSAKLALEDRIVLRDIATLESDHATLATELLRISAQMESAAPLDQNAQEDIASEAFALQSAALIPILCRSEVSMVLKTLTSTPSTEDSTWLMSTTASSKS